MSADAKWALERAQMIREEIEDFNLPAEEPAMPLGNQVLAHSIVAGTRAYIEKLVYQINGTYENSWFDGCAVMIRRLVETLIIEIFEHYKISDKIKKPNGDFFYLADLINAAMNEQSWNLGRNTRNALPKLKGIGDQSAHSRRFTAHRSDIDKIKDELRTTVQELLYLAELKK